MTASEQSAVNLQSRLHLPPAVWNNNWKMAAVFNTCEGKTSYWNISTFAVHCTAAWSWPVELVETWRNIEVAAFWLCFLSTKFWVCQRSTFEDVADRLYRNVGNYLPINAAKRWFTGLIVTQPSVARRPTVDVTCVMCGAELVELCRRCVPSDLDWEQFSTFQALLYISARTVARAGLFM